MKKFLIRGSFFVGIFVVLAFLFLNYGLKNMLNSINIDKNNYMMTLHDKYSLLKTTKNKKKRIILVGGSNLAFGIDSEKIQKELEIETINFGLHAGLGLRFMLKDLEEFLRPNDIVIITPEYSHFLNGGYGSDTLINYLLQFAPSRTKVLSKKQKLHLTKYFPKSFESLLSSFIFSSDTIITEENVYDRRGFNQHGDLIKHINMENQEFPNGEIVGDIDESLVSFLEKYIVKHSEVEFYFSFPVFTASSYDLSEIFIDDLHEVIKQSEKIIEINTPVRYRFNDELFFNTRYHLNGKGREIRTELLLDDIELALTTNSKISPQ